LAPIQSARGALIAFATEPGGVAADGEGENGLYTSFLLKHLKTPNLDVELMFKRVREDLVQATQNKQVPWEYSSLVGDFSFNPVTVAQSSQPNSTTAETYFKQGEDYRNNNQYDKALAAYTKAIEVNPQYAEAYLRRGNVYHDLKEYDKAIKDYNKAMADYNKALEIELEDVYASYKNRGNVYYNLKEYDKAMADYNKVLEIDPQDAHAYLRRGIVYYDLKEYDKAMADYNKAIEINPQYAMAYNNRGLVYYNLKEYDKAIKDYNKALEIDPKVPYASNNKKLAEEAKRNQ
jgi:tetratricopeptide (TPR) repeat protein